MMLSESPASKKHLGCERVCLMDEISAFIQRLLSHHGSMATSTHGQKVGLHQTTNLTASLAFWAPRLVISEFLFEGHTACGFCYDNASISWPSAGYGNPSFLPVCKWAWPFWGLLDICWIEPPFQFDVFSWSDWSFKFVEIPQEKFTLTSDRGEITPTSIMWCHFCSLGRWVSHFLGYIPWGLATILACTWG